MKKSDIDLVKNVAEMTDMSALTVDAIDKTPEVETEPQTKLTHRQIADQQGLKYIEPKKKLKAIGKLPEKLEAEHRAAWEYVKGVYENNIVNGEPVSFWLTLYPGDPDCLWEIPCNTPVYVPRFIAKHLESVQKYHTFSYIEKNPSQQRPDDFQYNFEATGTHYRGKFRPIGAFA